MLTRFLRSLLGGTPARSGAGADDAGLQQALSYLNDGVVAREQGDWKKSLMLLECAVALAPTMVAARVAFAASLVRTGKSLRALEQCREALRVDPEDRSAREMLAVMEDDARGAVAMTPPRPAAASSDGEAIRMALTLPHVLYSRSEIAVVREQLDQDLDRLSRSRLSVNDPATEVGLTAFYLAYHGENDRALHERIAALHLAACPELAWVAPHCSAPRPPGAQRMRVGLVSDYFQNHSIGRVTEGLVAKLDRSRFEVHVFGFREPFDELSRALAQSADEWRVLPRELAGARAGVARHALDVLLYPDVGMDPLTYFMTFARLAPVQCATWGHPVTTGVPAMDYFLSTDYFEPEDGASHYSERLVKLRDAVFPGYYRRPEKLAAVAPAELGFDATRRTYFSPQSLFKFHPDFDSVLARILRHDPRGELVLVYDEHTDTYRRPRLEARMKRAMPDVFDRITFLPRSADRSGYLQRLQACDVVLDTHPYCGGNTSLEAISMGALVVTLPSPMNRGRHTYAFFRKMGFMDTVARDADHYVELAVRIANDAPYRAHLKRLQAERAPALYEDQRAVDQIGDFFEQAVRPGVP